MSNHTPETIAIQDNNGYITVVDVADADLASKKWYIVNLAKGGYATRTEWINGEHTNLKLHRIIMERILGRTITPKEFVDHIDGNSLNNTRANLRLTDNSGNLRNSRRRKDNASGYKCVYYKRYSSGNGAWVSHISINGKQTRLGNFKTPEEAHEAYKKAALEHYGEFARFE